MSPKPLKIFFYSMDGLGHLNACIGMAQALAKRGHSIHFMLNEVFQGNVRKFGFDEILLRNRPNDKVSSNSEEEAKSNIIKQNAENVLKSGLFCGKSSLEKLISQMDNGNA